jgi:hypothetical protein
VDLPVFPQSFISRFVASFIAVRYDCPGGSIELIVDDINVKNRRQFQRADVDHTDFVAWKVRPVSPTHTFVFLASAVLLGRFPR